MTRINLLVFCLAAALFAGCTGNKKTYLDSASVLAYWTEGDAGVQCDDHLDCVELHDDLGDFQAAVTERRDDQSMELLRIAAHRSESGSAYAGVWGESGVHHVYSLELDRPGFETLHDERSQSRHRLVHFTIWKDVSGYKIAAIWRPPTPDEPPAPDWQRDVVQFDLEWSDLDDAPSGYYLDDIEIYPSYLAGNPPSIAAVWRPGAKQTRVLRGDHCTISHEPLTMEKEPGQEPPCSIVASEPLSPLPEGESYCPAIDEIEQIAMAAKQAGQSSFLRPADFELYTESDEERLAVLLQERVNRDWLMVPATWKAADCRHQVIGVDATLGFSKPFGLLDLDLVTTEVHMHPDIHEGVVHDGGTSGPPPP